MNVPGCRGQNTLNLLLRPAMEEDVSALLAIESQAFSTDRLSRRSFRRLIASPHAVVIVAEVAAKLVGYLLLLFRSNRRNARLYSIAVAPAAVRRGIGKSLLAAAEDAALVRQCRALRLEVHETNPGAACLYARSGYRMFGRRPGYYEDGGAALLFEKQFSQNPAEETAARLIPLGESALMDASESERRAVVTSLPAACVAVSG